MIGFAHRCCHFNQHLLFLLKFLLIFRLIYFQITITFICVTFMLYTYFVFISELKYIFIYIYINRRFMVLNT